MLLEQLVNSASWTIDRHNSQKLFEEKGNNLLNQCLRACLMAERYTNIINDDQRDKPPVANQFIRVYLFEQVVSLCELLNQFNWGTLSSQLRNCRIWKRLSQGQQGTREEKGWVEGCWTEKGVGLLNELKVSMVSILPMDVLTPDKDEPCGSKCSNANQDCLG